MELRRTRRIPRSTSCARKPSANSTNGPLTRTRSGLGSAMNRLLSKDRQEANPRPAQPKYVALSPERRSRLRQRTHEPQPGPQPRRRPATARNIVPGATYGRKERITPLTKNAATVLRSWLAELQPHPSAQLFPARHGGPLTRDGLERRLARHVAVAAHACPSLGHKRVTMHGLRHTTAMRLLHAGVDTTVIALWLGHESVETTQMYLHADLALKERALARTTPPNGSPGRYRPPDTLLGFLESL